MMVIVSVYHALSDVASFPSIYIGKKDKSCCSAGIVGAGYDSKR